VVNFTDRSWETFRLAAEKRNDDIYKNIFLGTTPSENSVPHNGYHRLCYQTYTTSSKLKRFSGNNISEPLLQSKKPKTRLSVPNFNINCCLFCQETKFIRKGASKRRTAAPLVKCLTNNAARKILEAAYARKDETILRRIEGEDLIAVDTVYHKTCYATYTSKHHIKRATTPKYNLEFAPYKIAFEAVNSKINVEILENKAILPLSLLKNVYIQQLNHNGVKITKYRSEKLKHRITKRFGSSIGFYLPPDRSGYLLYKADKSHFLDMLDKACDDVMQLEGSTDTEECSSSEVNQYSYPQETSYLDILHCALFVRKSLKSLVNKIPWPPHISNLLPEKSEEIIPTCLYNLLLWIIEGYDSDNEISIPLEKKQKAQSPNVHRQIISVAQDIIHCTSKGRTWTPKHILLPMTIHNMTGSKSAVTLLNRFGHTISYTELEELQTAMAESCLNQSTCNVFLPSNINPSQRVSLCFDNNDINEETLSGSGTTHCTNGIAIQRQLDECNYTSDIDVYNQKHRSKTRTITISATIATEYSHKKRCGPGNMIIGLCDFVCDHMISAEKMDFAWFLARFANCGNVSKASEGTQCVPSWTGFNSLASDIVPKTTSIGYCPVIGSSPTELSTVYSVLQYAREIAAKTGQPDIIITLDQAIYSKAQDILWCNCDEFNNVVLRMGAFHTAMTFMAVIGKRFADAGLTSLMVESGVLASGSVSAVLNGKHYNRGIRIHKIVMEALQRLRWLTYVSSDSFHELPKTLVSAVHNIQQSCERKNVDALLAQSTFNNLHSEFKKFCSDLDSNQPLANFWGSYIQMVELLLSFIRATREGNWKLHLECIKCMLPWFFAYDRINYSRYLTIYFAEMLDLPSKHPSAYEALNSGEFAVQQTTGTFCQTAVDQTIEQTINRSTKTKGGIIGFSLKSGTVHRWLVTAHERAKYSDVCWNHANVSSDMPHSKDLQSSRIQRDEQDVKKVMATVTTWHNPFTHQANDKFLINISSGSVATESITSDLLTAYSQGEECFKEFTSERLQSSAKSFFDPIRKLNLNTFSSLAVKSTVSTKVGKQVTLKADRNLLARMLTIAQVRSDSFNLRNVLKYSLGPIPYSLANVNGTLMKTTKSKLLELLECYSLPCEVDINNVSTWLYDGMAIIQGLKSQSIPKTMAELAKLVLSIIMKHTCNNLRVDFVCDTYPNISIKNVERNSRASVGSIRMKILGGNQTCPKQWKQYLSLGSNKEELIEFLFHQWKQDSFAPFYKGKLYMTHGKLCHCLCAQNGQVICTEVDELCSSHEEADTRLLLHAFHASQEASRNTIMIQTPDTDVAVIACSVAFDMPFQLLLRTGTKHRQRIIDISSISKNIGSNGCKALPGLHAFTGCDSTSSFCGHGKKGAFDMVIGPHFNSHFQSAMMSIGVAVDPPASLLAECERFVCYMYGKSNLSKVDEARYQLFCTKGCSSEQLPPTADELHLHLMRAAYQAAIWRRCCEAKPTDIDSGPHGHGWEVKDNDISIVWMHQPPAPDAILALISCGCKSGCSTNKRLCSCVKQGLPCTDACKCTDCMNKKGLCINHEAETEEDTDVDE